MGKLVIFDHPLMHHKLSLIRDEKTGTKDFRETVSEIANLMAYEVTRDLPTVDVEVKFIPQKSQYLFPSPNKKLFAF